MNFKFFKILILATFLFLSSCSLIYAGSDGINVNLNVGSCNNNGICEAGSEDFFSCPADCTPVVIPIGGGGGSTLVIDNYFNNLKIEVSYNTATITWTSAIPTISNLKWGTNPDYKDGAIQNINFLLDHKVELTNLKDGTLYYFSIQATSLLGKTKTLENQVFRTLTLPDTTPPGNPTNVQAVSNPSGITVSWDNPPDLDFDYVRVMKNTDRYYGSPYIGTLVYEGKGNYFVDSKVVAGKRYYYSLFSRDTSGNYSSGSMIDIVHNPKGKDTWGEVLTPVEIIPPLGEKYIVTQGSLSYDFKIGSIFNLSGDEPINIKTDYSSTLKNDDMWVAIKNTKRKIIWQYFFSRIKDKDGFINVDIPSFDEAGYYSINIYRYNNIESKAVAKIVNQGAFQITKASTPRGYSIYWYIIIIIILLLLILLLMWLIYRIYKKLRKIYYDRKSREDAN